MAKNPTWLCVVAAALRRADGRWLLHRRPLHKHHGGLWEFPGGKVEAGESLVSALIRELGEEIGVTLRPKDLSPAAFADDEGQGDPAFVILLYTARTWEGEPRALEPGSRIGWFTPGEIATLDRPPLDIALCAQIFGSHGRRQGDG